MSRPAVTLCMIALSAEAAIGKALGPAAGLFPEVIIGVDSRTADRTREIARYHGAEVFDFDWPDSFAEARNAVIGRARGEWLMWLDADEAIPPDQAGPLRSLLARLRGAGPAGYEFVQASQIGGFTYRVGSIRLFPNRPGLRWRYRCHEQILPALERAGLPWRRSGIRLDHAGYEDAGVARRKLERNLRLLEMDHAEYPDDRAVGENLIRTRAELEGPGTAATIRTRE